MPETHALDWLKPNDQQTLQLLDCPRTDRVAAPRESLAIRALIAASAPAWLGLTATMLVLRAATKRNRARPALVMHQRVGFDGQLLWVPKIATMVVPHNRAALAGLVEFASGPPAEGRVDSALDAWLRSSGLDELPQLGLIATGHMRLVGPRPVTPSEIDEMRETGPVGIDHVAPGLLGVWQLLDRDAYSLAERRELDLWMLQRWSPALRRKIVRIGIRQAHRRLRRSSRAVQKHRL